MGTPAFQTLGVKTGTNGTSITPSMPASISAGDTLIGYVGNDSGGVTVSASAGWNLGGSLTTGNMTGTFFWKDAVGGDTSPTFSWTGNITSQGQVLRFNGSGSPTSPIGATVSASGNTSTTLTAPSITTTADNSLLVYILMMQSNNAIPNNANGGATISNYGQIQSKAAGAFGSSLLLNGALNITGEASPSISETISSSNWVSLGFEILGSGSGSSNVRATNVQQQVLETYSDPKNVRVTNVILQVLCNVSGQQNVPFLNADAWFTCSTDDIINVPRILG